MPSFDPITAQGVSISNLFNLLLVLSAALFLLVAGLLVYILLRFRGRPGDPDPRQIEGNTRLEIAWTVSPLVLLAVIFVLTVRTMRAVAATQPPSLHVTVIGHQWWWELQYSDLGFSTANELHLPVGQPVVIELHSADVIHSFWVPQFGWMRDAIPGKTNVMPVRAERAGTYDGACTQFCGTQHAWMRSHVVAQSPAEFDAWVRGQQAAAVAPNDSLTQQGQAVFLANTCVSCHAIHGTTASASVAPDLTHLASRNTIGGGVADNTPKSLRRWIGDPKAIKPGVLMPGYDLSDADLNALVTYLGGLR